MYATVDDMKARFETAELIQLTDEALLGVIDPAKMATVLQEATNKINSYIAKRYPGPFARSFAGRINTAKDALEKLDQQNKKTSKSTGLLGRAFGAVSGALAGLSAAGLRASSIWRSSL